MNSEKMRDQERNNHQKRRDGWIITRRDFLKIAGLTAAGIYSGTTPVYAGQSKPGMKFRFGIVTDVHYADSPNGKEGQHYRESLVKMAECVERMNDEKVDFLIELGDFKDMSRPVSEKETLKYLKAIEKVFRAFRGPRYHVLGNHDMDCISKEQFLGIAKNSGISPKRSYYSFNRKGIHFVVLDANYLADGTGYNCGNFHWTDPNIPKAELDWLEKELSSSDYPCILFIHQLLNGEGDVYVNNAAGVRTILENSGRTMAVFQGHAHNGGYQEIEGIHYYTLKAMVMGSGSENNAYAIVDIYDDGLLVTGYRRAESRKMTRNS